jgi:hypothetical protein
MRTLSLADREGLDPDDYFPATIDSPLYKHLSPDEAWQLDTLPLDEHQVGAALARLAPSQPGSVALREALRRYRDLAARGGWPTSLPRRLASEGYDTVRCSGD